MPFTFSSRCLDTTKSLWTRRRIEPASSMGSDARPPAGNTPSGSVLCNDDLARRRECPDAPRCEEAEVSLCDREKQLRFRYCDYCVKEPDVGKYLKLCGRKLPVIIALGAYVLCLQRKSIFPSWTSWVRVPSPAPFPFNQLRCSEGLPTTFCPRITHVNGVDWSGELAIS